MYMYIYSCSIQWFSSALLFSYNFFFYLSSLEPFFRLDPQPVDIFLTSNWTPTEWRQKWQSRRVCLTVSISASWRSCCCCSPPLPSRSGEVKSWHGQCNRCLVPCQCKHPRALPWSCHLLASWREGDGVGSPGFLSPMAKRFVWGAQKGDEYSIVATSWSNRVATAEEMGYMAFKR